MREEKYSSSVPLVRALLTRLPMRGDEKEVETARMKDDEGSGARRS